MSAVLSLPQVTLIWQVWVGYVEAWPELFFLSWNPPGPLSITGLQRQKEGLPTITTRDGPYQAAIRQWQLPLLYSGVWTRSLHRTVTPRGRDWHRMSSPGSKESSISETLPDKHSLQSSHLLMAPEGAQPNGCIWLLLGMNSAPEKVICWSWNLER